MCGLVGIAGDINLKEEKVFKDLLMLDVIRGKHSTGVASLYKNGNVWSTAVFKDSLNAVDYMDKQEFTQLMAKKHHILMGHNRWATRGAIIQQNAHPFEFDNLIGAHNGSLISTYTLHDQAKYQVDSQCAFSEMNENGVESLWGKLNGAAALTWIDKRDQTINFLRNDDRPLWFTTLNKGKTLIWASESWMIHVACGRQGVDIDKNPREVLIDKHYKFHLPASAAKKDGVVMETTPVKAYVAPKWEGSYSYYGDSYYRNDYAYAGERHYKAEDVGPGDFVEFTVNLENGIKDHKSGNNVLSTVYGKSLKGTPIRIFDIDANRFEDLLLEMWEQPDLVFKAKVSYATDVGLILSVYSCEQCFYTTHDLAAAEEEKKDDKKTLPPGVKFHSFPYKVGCSFCGTLVKAYYTTPSAGVCCEECWDAEIGAMTNEQRSSLKLGYRRKHK